MATRNEPEGPSIIPVILIGVLTFVFGGALGLASLISQPILVLNKDPDPESLKPGTVYLVRGDNLGGNTWRSKEDAWKSGLVEELTLGGEHRTGRVPPPPRAQRPRVGATRGAR